MNSELIKTLLEKVKSEISKEFDNQIKKFDQATKDVEKKAVSEGGKDLKSILKNRSSVSDPTLFASGKLIELQNEVDEKIDKIISDINKMLGNA